MYSLTSTWTLKQGKEKAGVAALKRLAERVRREEADTLAYLVHMPDVTQASLPPPYGLDVVFFEIYRNKAAFDAHVNGSVFTEFVAKHGDLFVSMKVDCGGGKSVTKPFTTVEFLRREAGFIRPELADE